MYDDNSNPSAVTLVALNAAAAAVAAAAAANTNINPMPPVSSTSCTTSTGTLNTNGVVNPTAPIVNSTQLVNQLLTAKDSRWLQLEVCREYQRGQCSRSELECKFAHPPSHVDVQNGRVTACYDSIKGRCTRENPKCKYLHPPQHLKDQLLINGRQHLQLKNQICSQLTSPATIQPSIPLIAQLVQQQQILPTTLSYQYFSQLPTTLYPTLMPGTTTNVVLDPYQVQPPLPATVMQQLALIKQQQQQAFVAAAASGNLSTPDTNSFMANAIAQQQRQQQQQQLQLTQVNPAMLMAFAQQQQQRNLAQLQAQTALAFVHNNILSSELITDNNNCGSSNQSVNVISTRKRNADNKWESESPSKKNGTTTKLIDQKNIAGTSSNALPVSATVSTGTTSALARIDDSGNLSTLQNQLLFINAAVNNNNSNRMPSLKLNTVDKNSGNFGGLIMTKNATTAAVAAAAASNGVLPPIPIYAAHAAATQFNPYYQSIQIPAAYLPAAASCNQFFY